MRPTCRFASDLPAHNTRDAMPRNSTHIAAWLTGITAVILIAAPVGLRDPVFSHTLLVSDPVRVPFRLTPDGTIIVLARYGGRSWDALIDTGSGNVTLPSWMNAERVGPVF